MKMKNDGVDLFPLPASVSGVLAACGLLLLGLPVMAATIPVNMGDGASTDWRVTRRVRPRERCKKGLARLGLPERP